MHSGLLSAKILQRDHVFGLAALASSLLLAVPGCSKVSSGGVGGGGNPWTIHGVLRIGSYEDLDNLNPVLSNELYATNVFQLLYSGLIDYDDRGNAVPDLATSVPSLENGGISKDGRTITYRLRRGVVWSDGVPLTSADVRYTWQQIMNPRNNVAYRYPYDQALSVDAPDPYTVVARLAEPSAPFVANFMRNGSVGSIVPKHLLDRYSDLNRISFNTHPLGSGPFVLARWEPGALLDMKPNPRYFRGPPKLAEVQYKIIPNQNTLLTSVESHAIDLFLYATETQYAVLKRATGYRVTVVPNLTYEHVAFNCARPPLDDVRIRQAIAYAIDWKKINDDAYLGLDVPGMADQSPQLWAYDPAVKPYPHDRAKAAALLAQAGWESGADGLLARNGKRFTIDISSVVGNGTRLKAEELIQSDLREVGIDLNVRNYPANLLFASYGGDGILARGKFDLALYGWSENPDPDDTDTIGPDSIPPSGVNYTRYADQDIKRWQTGGRMHYSRAERTPYYWKIQERIHEAVPFHTINWQAHIDAVNVDLQNFRPAPAVADFWNAYEWNI
jgi:peptide/nickel transport system substrate-binding protein